MDYLSFLGEGNLEKYRLKFYFEHGGICFWSMNAMAHDKYGYPIETSRLPMKIE